MERHPRMKKTGFCMSEINGNFSIEMVPDPLCDILNAGSISTHPHMQSLTIYHDYSHLRNKTYFTSKGIVNCLCSA